MHKLDYLQNQLNILKTKVEEGSISHTDAFEEMHRIVESIVHQTSVAMHGLRRQMDSLQKYGGMYLFWTGFLLSAVFTPTLIATVIYFWRMWS